MSICRKLVVLCFPLLSTGLPAPGSAQEQKSAAQEAKTAVVLFTPGSHWRGTASQFKTLLFGKADMMSSGFVFDGKEKVAVFTHSRYVVLKVAPGQHVFSAAQSHKHPNPKEALTLDLKPGSITYLAVTTTTTNYGVGLYETITSHIGIASCAEFVEDHAANRSEPVEMKHIADAYRTNVDSSIAALPCAP